MQSTPIPLANADIQLFSGFLAIKEADCLLAQLLRDVSWSQPELTLFGKKVKSPRLAAWYGDAKAVYRYSGLVNHPMPWLEPLEIIRAKLEAYTGSRFNSVLLNLYRDGNDAMGWHADNEEELGSEPVIASVSLGATRTFRLRESASRRGPGAKLELDHGSLLLMAGQTQRFWKHAIPRTRKPVGQRINLTYREILIDR